MPPPPPMKPVAEAPEQALSKLLSLSQLNELAVLISNIAETMHKQMTDDFDTSVAPTVVPQENTGDVGGKAQAGIQEPSAAVNEGFGFEASQTGTEHESGGTGSEARIEGKMGPRAGGERSLDRRKLNDLGTDALEYFQMWRDGIVSKIVAALNSKDEETHSEDLDVFGTNARAQRASDVAGMLPPPAKFHYRKDFFLLLLLFLLLPLFLSLRLLLLWRFSSCCVNPCCCVKGFSRCTLMYHCDDIIQMH
jgi:hypothetical protein